MKLNYNEKELQKLLKDFHHLTGMTLTLYDPEGEWIFKQEYGMSARKFRETHLV